MSTSVAFVELSDRDVTMALSEVLMPRLKEHILSRAPGHCMRIANLDLDLMIMLTLMLRQECPSAQIYILGANGTLHNQEQELFISSTKLVELRNPLPDGELRPPLLIFLPANLQASAEDSFGVATFEDIPVTDVYQVLLERSLERVPPPLQGYVKDLLAIPGSVWWPWADQVAQVRFLLTAIKNQVDGESLGASLYELGLVPDFHLFADPALMHNRIRRNLESVRKLTHSDASVRGRVVDLGLSDKTMQRRLSQFLSEVGLVEPPIWTRQIVVNKQNRDISFDKWKFIDEINNDKISIQVLDIGIPRASEKDQDERLNGLNGQHVLNPLTQTKFSVTFQAEPHPARVPSLDHFTAQIFTQDGEPVGGAKRIKAWTAKKNTQTIQLDKLNKLELEDGWHFVRILPWTKDDDPVPLEAPHRETGDERRRSHDSEEFYVLLDGEVSELPQRAIPWEASFEHARLRTQFKELAEQRDPRAVNAAHILWINKGSKSRQVLNEVLEVKFERGGKFHINVSHLLKVLERAILTSPESVVNWRWSIKAGKIESEQPVANELQWPRSAAVESFLDARALFCEAACAQVSDKEPIMEAVDLSQLRDCAIAYAEAYRDLLLDFARKVEQSRGTDQQKNILALRTALSIDSVHVILTDFRGRTKEALLVGPTHPLRALWFATWTQVAQQWLVATSEGSEEYIVPVRDALLNSLAPLNMPATLPYTDGRVFTTVDNLTPFWSLYAAPTEEDTRGLLGELCALLGLSEPAISGDAITADVLAARITRYLVQHPYIRTLSINAFNPGRATVLAEAIMQLQKQDSFALLRYDIRLFVPDPAMPRVGEAIESLLSPDTTINTDTTDVFASPGRSHLFPKLSLAIHPLTAFYDEPQRYRAHLSMLFDLFPAEEIGAGSAFNLVDTTPIYGLVQDFASRFHDEEDSTFWQWQPRHGHAQPLPDMDASITLLADLSRSISGAVATVATGVAAFEQRPIITLSLSTIQRELIHHVHNMSDWVLTIDRHIDVEFFDHGGRSDRPEYLIDYVPGGSSEQGHKLITTSRNFLELDAALKPLLEQHSLPVNQYQTNLILDQLRALSGRLALKLISSPTHQTETLGLALARLFLIEQGALANQIILPLDVHLNLFHMVKRVGEELGEVVALQRTDLALFDLNASTRTIRCNLVEVKCYSHVGGPSAYAQLKESIAEQIEQSEHVLRHHFDPARKSPDRPDRLLKTRELRILLEFYLGRSERYGLMQSKVAEEARFLLATLEEGYTLTFTRSALIFDFEQPGTEPPDVEQDIEFYRIGKDQIDALITEVISSPSPTSDRDHSRESTSSSVPHWPSAAFVVPDRERTVSQSHSEQSEATALPEQQADEMQYEQFLDESATISPSDLDEEAVPAQYDEFTMDEQYSAIEESEDKPSPVEQAQSPEVGHTAQSDQPPYSAVLGAQGATPQYGILGEISGKKVALDLNQTHTISLFGVQGSGKSYTLGSIVEMACLPIPNVNVLPAPLATVIFHYSPTQDYKPEFTSMVMPNTDQQQIARLQEQYGASPQALRDMVLLVPAAKLTERRNEYPDIEVQPITFAASELKAIHWKFLMGAIGSQSMYIREMNLMMKQLRDKLTLEGLRQEVENSTMADRLKKLAQDRLRFAAEYIDDSRELSGFIRPGRLIIVDVRDEFIEKDEALGLFVVLLQIFSEATYQGSTFNKLVVFDEAHKYIENGDLVAGLIEVVREMRHKGTSILVASQDPPSVPVSLIELSSQIILHRCNSPAWLKHIQKANTSLNSLTPEKMSRLGAGEAYIWSAKATDEGFTKGAIKVKLRPRVTRHGGDTKTAVL
jgi:DNA phosphorothioation-dependent restriction protein DptH